jgi:hypothetical protein
MDGSAVAVGLLLGVKEGMKVGNCLGFAVLGFAVGSTGFGFVLGGSVGSIGTLVGS